MSERNQITEHYCQNTQRFPVNKFLQRGTGRGRKLLIVGESPAQNGWRESQRAFYTAKNQLIPSGKNLAELLGKCDLTLEICGFTELVKCYVGKDTSLFWRCGERCWDIFQRQLAAYDFRVILTLGVKTLALINKQLNSNLSIGSISKTKINSRRYWLLPVYHPSPANPYNHQKNLIIIETVSDDVRTILRRN